MQEEWRGYVNEGGGKYLRESILFAYSILLKFENGFGFENRGVKFGDFQVLREMSGFCPGVLLELGFLSQVDEAIYLYRKESQNAVALVILNRLVNF